MAIRHWLLAIDVPIVDLVPLAQAAERAGFHGIAMGEHVVLPAGYGGDDHPSGKSPFDTTTPFPDPFTAFAAIGTATTTLHMVTYVFVPSLRHPLTVAKQVATASDLTVGRVALGVGSGWLAEEFAALDAPFSARGGRTDEMLTIIIQLWRDGQLAFDGKHFRFESVVQTPPPSQQISIYVGGRSTRALRRAARHDGWLGPRLGVDELARIVERVRAFRRETRPDDAFSVFAVPLDPQQADEYVAIDGVTDLVIALWGFDEGGVGPTLSERIDALEAFAAVCRSGRPGLDGAANDGCTDRRASLGGGRSCRASSVARPSRRPPRASFDMATT